MLPTWLKKKVKNSASIHAGNFSLSYSPIRKKIQTSFTGSQTFFTYRMREVWKVGGPACVSMKIVLYLLKNLFRCRIEPKFSHFSKKWLTDHAIRGQENKAHLAPLFHKIVIKFACFLLNDDWQRRTITKHDRLEKFAEKLFLK